MFTRVTAKGLATLMLSRYVKSPVLRAVGPASEGTQMDAGRPKGDVRTEESGQHHDEAS